MEREIVNPWTWQDQFGFVQANKLTGAERVVFCAGQTSVDEDGLPLHPGDIVAQVDQALDNLETVLNKAGLTLANVVRLNYFTTDVDEFSGAGEQLARRLAKAGCRPASTLLGVVRLAFPELMIEIEATAAG
jgi:enamine deaminase RidA (YjgF/YER057c/UK114 family)